MPPTLHVTAAPSVSPSPPSRDSPPTVDDSVALAELFDAGTKLHETATALGRSCGMSRAQEASLTVFRHFDSATVVKGLVGRAPKTAWVVGYPLLERIHYLLVAGLDVFGNVGHQLTTRLYMDFLRMEGEADFLMFLPPARRRELTDSWYRGVDGAPKATIANELAGWVAVPGSSIGLRCWHGLAVLPPFDALFRCLAKCERAACPSDSRTNA